MLVPVMLRAGGIDKGLDLLASALPKLDSAKTAASFVDPCAPTATRTYIGNVRQLRPSR